MYWVEGGFAKEQVQEGCVVGLNNEEEDLFGRYAEKCRTDNGMGRVGPYSLVDEVRVPRRSRYNGYLIECK